MACEKDHTITDKIVKDLPINQGSFGRHKCASCAYEKGVENGKIRLSDFDYIEFIKTLPNSQKGDRRHRDPVLAYILGFSHGEHWANKNLTIKDKLGISLQMKEFGLSMVAKGIKNAFTSNSEIPYSHAMSIVHVAHGFEILIKSKIVEEHPLLIFKGIPKETNEDIEFNDLLEKGITIDYKDLPHVLWATTGFKIKEKQLYKELGYQRNQIIHFFPKSASFTDLTIKYAFNLIEIAINEWWSETLFKELKVYDIDLFEKLFRKLESLDIKVAYKYDKDKKYLKK